MEPAPLDELAAHAHNTHVVVVGGGIGGLVAALACAKIGIRVTVVDACDRLGGALHTTDVGGARVDVAAEGYATRGGEVRALIDELGLGDAVVPTAPRAEWIAGLPSGLAPLPAATIRGIPENPWEEGVRRMIGWRGTWRAYLDRLRPPLTIGQERSLGRLVRTRMGDLVHDRLVAPLSLGGFSIHPDDVDVEVAAPGLSAALTRTGSLAGAVASLRATAAKRPAGAGLEAIDGGTSRLVDALIDRLRGLGVRVVTGVPIEGLSPHPDGRWAVIVAPGDGAAHAAVTGAVPPDAVAPNAAAAEADRHGIEPADHVVVATDAVVAHRLLSGPVPELEPMPVTDLEVVTLVVVSAELAAAPARTAVYPVEGRAVAASVTDSTARWPWMARDAAPGVRVLKVTFGAPGETPATAALDDAAAVALAVSEASALLGEALDTGQVRGWHRGRYFQPPPVSAIGHRAAVERVREAVHEVPGLAVVGAWVAGTGIAQVVPDALAEAERIRRVVLWGSADERA
ncbi:MAG: protoporphyrinogen/coproporphyrinogen oxidase [Microbacterium sp.]